MYIILIKLLCRTQCQHISNYSSLLYKVFEVSMLAVAWGYFDLSKLVVQIIFILQSHTA